MPGATPSLIGPFTGGLHNASGRGENIQDTELFQLINFEVDSEDGTLVNRPGIKTINNSAIPAASTIIGSFYSPGEAALAVISNGTNVQLVDIKTGSSVASRACSGHAGAQFQDRFYIAPVRGKTDGGYYYFSAPGVPTWVSVAVIPAGDSMAVYQLRLWVASGDQEAGTDGTLYSSAISDGTKWDVASGGGARGIGKGDGQRLKAIIVMNNDIMCFKEHSTYRYTYTSSPANAITSKISNTIGCPNYNAAAVYDNNSIFVFHGQEVWQLYAYNFTKISTPVNLVQISGPNTVSASLAQCLSICFDRLFVRYWSTLYVYNLNTKVWSQWVTSKDFDKVMYFPAASNTTDLDCGFMVPAGNISTGARVMINDHYSNIGAGLNLNETFTCSLQTKIFDFDEPWAYKVLFWWGLHIAAAGTYQAQAIVPNAIRVVKWRDVAQRTWGDGANYKWGSGIKISTPISSQISSGEFGRRFVKNRGKMRFRQIYWTISYTTQYNAEDDAIIRIYSIAPVLKPKETVSRTMT